MSEVIVELDSRNRISLGKVANRAERYKVVEEPDGTIVLYPADVLTRDEQKYLANAAVVAAVERSEQHPERRREWQRRTPRR